MIKDFEQIKNIIKIEQISEVKTSKKGIKKHSFGLKITTKANIYKMIFVNCQLVEDINTNSMDINNIYHIDFFRTDRNNYKVIFYRTERNDSIFSFELTSYIANKRCQIKITKKKNTRYIIEEKIKLKKMNLLKKEICKQLCNDSYTILGVSQVNNFLSKNSLEVSMKHDIITFQLHNNLLFEIIYRNINSSKYIWVKEDRTGLKLYEFQRRLEEEGAHDIVQELVQYAYSLFF